MGMMRALPATVVLLSPGAVFAALLALSWPDDRPPAPVPPADPGRIEAVDPAPTAPAAPSARDHAARVAETLRAWPEAAVVSCPLEGRLRFAVMPLHVHLDTPGDRAPFDYAVVEDTLVLAVPPGTGAANLSTGDAAGLGRLSWPALDAGEAGRCSAFRWTQGPLEVPGLVRGRVPRGAVVRACDAQGGVVPVQKNGGFTLVLSRSAAICRVRLEADGHVGPWQEVRADRLDGTVWLDPPG